MRAKLNAITAMKADHGLSVCLIPKDGAQKARVNTVTAAYTESWIK
jgi:hypothetical protein